MKLNQTIAMGLISLATLSFAACGDSSKDKDKGAPAAEATAAPAEAASGPTIRVLDGNGSPVAQAGINIVITPTKGDAIKLKTGDDGTVALPKDVPYPVTITAESEGHTYTTSHLAKAEDIFGNKVVLLQK